MSLARKKALSVFGFKVRRFSGSSRSANYDRKNAFHHLGKFCQSNDIDSLFSMANTLSELFLLKGELITTDPFGDRETSYWSVPQGSCHEWIQSLTTSEGPERKFVSFRISFDNNDVRCDLVKRMPVCLVVIFCLISSI